MPASDPETEFYLATISLNYESDLITKRLFNNKLVPSKGNKLVCAPIKDSDQPVHPHSLIRVIDGHSMGSQGSNASAGGKLRL